MRDVRDTPERILTCCVCGRPTWGRQWYNRDRGFGLCPACAIEIDADHKANPRANPDTAHSMAGMVGVHRSLNGRAS